jgi:GNAT superfamily N-acetyltransferase
MISVEEITAAETHPLRRAVLRAGDPASDVRFPQDELPGAFHLGAFVDGELVGVASFALAATPYRDAAVGWQLRGMAVHSDQQGLGVGAAIIAAAAERVRASGARVLWCNARDTAIGFYEKLGFNVYGDGFVTGDTGLPHHVMLLDL